MAQASEPALEQVYYLTGKKYPRLASHSFIILHNLSDRIGEPAFYAVSAMAFPPGLIPVYAVERNESFELRRLPPKGRENFMDPLFFALPPEEETGAARVAGAWDCTAESIHGIQSYFGWELAISDDQVTGRFDPNTDYRFAFITGGSFQSNRLELFVEYINDRYQVTGDWKDGTLAGTWRRTDDDDHGAWEATRPATNFSLPPEAVPLYEWVRSSDNTRHYSIDPEWNETGWERSPRPLCRVWPKEIPPH
jgi:hypothetical protein